MLPKSGEPPLSTDEQEIQPADWERRSGRPPAPTPSTAGRSYWAKRFRGSHFWQQRAETLLGEGAPDVSLEELMSCVPLAERSRGRDRLRGVSQRGAGRLPRSPSAATRCRRSRSHPEGGCGRPVAPKVEYPLACGWALKHQDQGRDHPGEQHHQPRSEPVHEFGVYARLREMCGPGFAVGERSQASMSARSASLEHAAC
jgi:hypothetical protein